MVGFMEIFVKEGVKYNIIFNVIVFIVVSCMIEIVMFLDVFVFMKFEWVVFFVVVLVYKNNISESGFIFEVGGGYIVKFRWERFSGLFFKCDDIYIFGVIFKKWNKVIDFFNL